MKPFSLILFAILASMGGTVATPLAHAAESQLHNRQAVRHAIEKAWRQSTRQLLARANAGKRDQISLEPAVLSVRKRGNRYAFVGSWSWMSHSGVPQTKLRGSLDAAALERYLADPQQAALPAVRFAEHPHLVDKLLPQGKARHGYAVKPLPAMQKLRSYADISRFLQQAQKTHPVAVDHLWNELANLWMPSELTGAWYLAARSLAKEDSVAFPQARSPKRLLAEVKRSAKAQGVADWRWQAAQDIDHPQEIDQLTKHLAQTEGRDGLKTLRFLTLEYRLVLPKSVADCWRSAIDRELANLEAK